MKTNNLTKAFLFLLLIICDCKFAKGQATTAGSSNLPGGGGDFLGWATGSFGTVFDLTIRNDEAMPINFYTNALPRMQIYDAAASPLAGYVGIGDFTAFTPNYLLHQHIRDKANTYHQFTNDNTGNGALDGFRIGLSFESLYDSHTGSSDQSFAKLIQEEHAPIKFYTGQKGLPAQARMIINSDYVPTIHSVTQHTDGYVGIGMPFFWQEEAGTFPKAEGPRSLLHLQGNYDAFTYGGNGWRGWMKTGCYINENSDEMYIGLKNESRLGFPNRSDAIIMWGDDQYNQNDGTADNFRIIFSGNSFSGHGTGTNPLHIESRDGLEVARITPFGRMGIGPLFSWDTPPCRRLELLDYQNRDGISQNVPQLRLTYTQSNFSNLLTTGVWTDFQTTSSGNLYVHPSSTNVAKNVGINESSPITTLHVGDFGTHSTSDGLITSDALNHTFNPVPPAPTGFPWVMYSDDNGTLQHLLPAAANTNVLHGDGSWSDIIAGGVNSTCISVNIIPKVSTGGLTDLVCSQIFDNGTNVGVGTIFPLQKLDVAGYVNAAQHNGYNINNTTVLKDQGTANIFAGGNCGSTALADNMTTTGNTYAGYNCGASNKWSSNNTFMGFNAGYNAKGTGPTDNNCVMNTLIGAGSGNVLQPASSAEYANGNTLVGYNAATYLTKGGENTSLGTQSLYGAVSGDRNTFIGTSTGTWSATIPTNCNALGHNAQVLVTGTVNNATAIGADAYVGCSDCMVLGSTPAGLINQVSVGIGYNSPATVGAGGPFLLAVNNNGSGNSAWFNGNIWALGGTWSPSDAALKENIQPFTNADKIINNLVTHTFTFNSADYRGLHLPKGPQIGFIAEELERVLPSLVQQVSSPEQRNAAGELLYPSYTFKGVNYEGLIPILVSHAKEQNQKIASLMTRDSLREIRLADLESIVKSCCPTQAPQQGNNSGQSERTGSAQPSVNARLEQNQPNPFNSKTEIRFFIPETATSKTLMLFDMQGTLLKQYSLDAKGESSITIFANELKAGMYLYSLIVDGKEIDTKKMILTN